ncbi:MAG: MFS transporter [Solirubrobacteraceae bacterium]|nr:MFS transporter [Solirubrobacteraceae bacterium]
MRASSGSSDTRAVLAAVALSGTLLPLNSTMIAVALPDIASDTGGGVAASSWLVTSYVVAMAALGPFAGRLGDRLGRRRVLLWGLAAFALASAAAGAAPSLGLLVAARLGQAIAGSLVFPNAIALLRDALPEGHRARGFGLLGSAVGAAAAVGPALGGVLVGTGGWRAIFLVNLPVVAAAVVLTLRSLPAAAPAPRPASARGQKPARWDWAQPLRVPVFGAASGAVALSNLAMYGTLLAVPVVLADRPGWSAADAGVALAMLSVAMIALAPIGGRLADRRGHRLPAAAGLALLTAATAMLAAMGAAPSAAGLACALLLGGIGLGLANAAVQTAALEAVAPRHAGVAAGLFSTARYGGSIGSALLLAALLGGGGEHAQAFFTVAALSAAGSALLALRLGGPPRLAVGEPATAAAADAR